MADDSYNPEDYYTAKDFNTYMTKVRGSIADPIGRVRQVPSFTNISADADAGAFDVRSVEKRFLDDLAEEEEVLALTKEKQNVLERELSIRQGNLDTLETPEEVQSRLTSARFDYEEAITSGSQAIREQAGLPDVERMLLAVMKSDPTGYKKNPLYKTLYVQRQGILLDITKKENDMIQGHLDSRLYIQQAEDRLKVVTRHQANKDELDLAATKLEQRVKTTTGFTKEEENVYRDIIGREVEPADISDLESKEETKWFVTQTAAGRKYNASEILQLHPSAYPAWKTYTEKDSTIDQTAVVRATDEWEAKAKKEERQAIASYKPPARITDAEEIEDRRQAEAVRARIRSLDESRQEFKKANTDLSDLDLSTDPTVKDPKIVEASKFILGYMKKRIGEGESLYDVSPWQVFLFTQEVITASHYKDSLIGVDLNAVARKMFDNLKRRFNAKYKENTGVMLKVDDFAMWGVQPHVD